MSRWWVVAIIVAALAAAAGVQTLRLRAVQAEIRAVQAEYNGFVDRTALLGVEAESKAKETEAKNAKRLGGAMVSRADALRRLREYQAGAGGSKVPLVPAAAESGDRLCFDQAALAAAVERYRGRIRGLVAEGDAAHIDAQSLIYAWPQ